jgi:hypothetical protein
MRSTALAADRFKEESKRHWRTTGHLLTLDGTPILAVHCHEDGEAAVLHRQPAAALCRSSRAMLTRHIAQQNPSFNASAFSATIAA